jgi:hypothetical protein
MTTKRPLVILVADGTMKAVFQAFFRRSHFFHSLQCAAFEFDPARDVFNDPLQTDGGVCNRCDVLLRGYQNTHHRALVVIDQQFGAERPADEVRAEMEARLRRSGWEDRVEVVVIDPELEVWLWQDNPNVERALNYKDTLRKDLLESGEWPAGAAKPERPKETMQRLIRANRAGAPIAVYSKIAGTVSVNGCVDTAFACLRATVQRWFPAEGA